MRSLGVQYIYTTLFVFQWFISRWENSLVTKKKDKRRAMGIKPCQTKRQLIVSLTRIVHIT